MNPRQPLPPLSLPLVVFLWSALLMVPAALVFNKPVTALAGRILCPPGQERLLSRVWRNLATNQRRWGAARTKFYCIPPEKEEDCRWNLETCGAILISTPKSYSVIFALGFCFAALIATSIVLYRRRSAAKI